MKNKARFKWNNSLLALLCSKCSVIIKTGKDFTEEELKACKGKKYLPPQYCELHNTECPKCGERENFHYNYDYSKLNTPVIDVLCNECGEFFKEK